MLTVDVLALLQTDRSKALALAFGSDSELVVGGVGFIKFFSLSEKSGELKSKKGSLKTPKEAIVAITFLDQDVITGGHAWPTPALPNTQTASTTLADRLLLFLLALPPWPAGAGAAGSGDGCVSLWKGRSAALRREGVHRKAINSLFTCTDATAAFVSGGADGLVVLWNTAIEAVKVLDMALLGNPPPLQPVEVRSVCALNGFVLVGTKASEVFEVNLATLETAE